MSDDLQRLNDQMEKLGISHGEIARMIGRSTSIVQKQLTRKRPLKPYVLEAVQSAIEQRLVGLGPVVVDEPQERKTSMPDTALEAEIAEKLKEFGGTIEFSPLMRTASGRRYMPDIVYRSPGPDFQEFAIDVKPISRQATLADHEAQLRSYMSAPAPGSAGSAPRESMLADLEAKILAVETVELLLESHDLTDIEELKAVLLRQRDKIKLHRSVLDLEDEGAGAEDEDGDETPGNAKRADAAEHAGRTAR